MKHVSLDDLDADEIAAESERARLGDALGTTDVAVTHYRLAAKEGLPGGLHAHSDQEEAFVVLDGTLTFEVLGPAREKRSEITVDAGDAVRFAPGEFQSGRNDGPESATVLGLGAPPESDDIRLPLACRACARGDVRLETDAGSIRFVCPDCAAEFVPQPCPDCGHSDLRATLDGDRTVVACQGCGSEYDRPPVERA